MACTGCATKFGLFRKEKSCQLCHLSFCPKCLEWKDFQNQRHLVCRNCASGRLQRNADLIFNCNEFNTRNKNDPRTGGSKVQNNEDNVDELEKRLELLKNRGNDSIVKMTEDDINKRLCDLKGQKIIPDASKNHSWLIVNKPKLTAAEEMNNLLKEYRDEHLISSKILTPEEEITRRLAKLRGHPETEVTKDPHSEQPQASSTKSAAAEKSSEPEEFLKNVQQPHVKITTANFDKIGDDMNLDEVEHLLRLAHTKNNLEAEKILNNKEVQQILKDYKSPQRKKANKQSVDEHSNSSDEDESEIEAVIKDVLSRKEEEDEIRDM